MYYDVRVMPVRVGPGMDAQTIWRIFDPFFTTKEEGHGLGLAAVDGIVRGHHGAMRIDSTPGKGSRFAVWFPRAERDAAEPAGTPETDAAAPADVRTRQEAALRFD